MHIIQILSLLIAITTIIGHPVQAKDMVIKEPPKSLDKFYPPQSDQPKWTQQMHKLSTHFGGVFINLKEKDFENVDKHAEKLVEEYKKTSEMVPEWEEYFDIKAAEAFAAAARTHDIAKAGNASGDLGKTCGKCHAEHQVAVWTKYHWPSFHKIKVIDPSSEKEVYFHKFMKQISGSFKAMRINFGEGQYGRAARALKTFKSEYMELKSTCSKCHTTDDVKRFYVGGDASRAFAGLTKELNAEKPNPGKFWKNVGLVGKTGCKNCHLTHRTYSKIKEVWEENN